MKTGSLRSRDGRVASWLDSLAGTGLARGVWRHPRRQLLAHQDALWVTARVVGDYPDDRFVAAQFMNAVAVASAAWRAEPRQPSAITNNTDTCRERAARWLEAAGARKLHDPMPASLALAALVLMQQLFEEHHPTDRRERIR